MRLGNKIGLIIILIIPVWIFIRAQLIYVEGPKVVRVIEEYKAKNNSYPDTLQQSGIRSIFNPWYFHDKEKEEFSLMYSIFAFSRWNYSSKDRKWYNLD